LKTVPDYERRAMLGKFSEKLSLTLEFYYSADRRGLAAPPYDLNVLETQNIEL
jgi:hypothetical protein